MTLNQETRMLALQTPLGENQLLLTGFRGREEMSRLFRFELEMISDNNAIAAADIVGKNVTFSVKLADNSPRFFNGFVSRLCAGDEDDIGRRDYRAEVVPWLWFLTRTSDCRIFQGKTAPDIIEQIFGDLGFSDYELQLDGSHPQREYTVQYQETDFNFVSRLAEEEGIFWFFTHEGGKHTLVLADHKRAYVDCQEQEVDYPRDVGSRAIEDHITRWEHRYEFRSGKWAQTDYNFETPSNNLMTNEGTVVELPGTDKFEFYDYPGLYRTTGDGSPLTRVRIEEEEVEHDVVEAESMCKTFTPGGKFKIRQHRSGSEEGKSFVIATVEHNASEPLAYETGAAEGLDYRNRCTCIPDSVTFRPARITRKPIVQGLESAVVVGPSGEEIYTDKYGRVKVQFHWDREGKREENSSIWIRVSQFWAGKQWGAHFWPRIGHEVVIDFLNGDPDRPLIVGSVYHAENTPPYELPANQTRSGIRTHSSKGGGGDNFNEIRFEDKKGEEQLLVHAEKNHDVEVENDETHWVGHDRKKRIDNDETTLIKRNQYETVEGDRAVHVVGAFKERIDSGETRLVKAGVTESIVGGEERAIDGDQKETISGALEQTIVGGATIKTPASWDLTAVGGVNITAPAGVKILAPGGMQVIAPGGQTQVDSFWQHQGASYKWTFAEKVGIAGIKNELVGITNAFQGVVIGNVGVKLENVGVLAATEPLTMKQASTKLKNGAIGLYMYGITLIS